MDIFDRFGEEIRKSHKELHSKMDLLDVLTKKAIEDCEQTTKEFERLFPPNIFLPNLGRPQPRK